MEKYVTFKPSETLSLYNHIWTSERGNFMRKKILALVMAFSMMLTISVPTYAAQTTPSKPNPNYTLFFTNTDFISSVLNFSGSKAECNSEIYAKSGTTKIVATIMLKQVTSTGTKTVKTWTQTTKGELFYFYKEYYVTKGHDYELEVNAKVYRNGSIENLSLTDYDYCG